MNFALAQHHKYSITEMENMLPWEFSVYTMLLIKHLKEEKERLEQLQKQKKR